MSRRTSTSRPPSIPISPPGATTLFPGRLLLALGWLLLFCGWFYSFELPNNRPAARWMIWSLIPFDLLDLIDPPVEPNAAPWGLAHLGQRIPFMGIACVIWGASICLGRLALRVLKIQSLFERIERLFFAGCLGLSAVSLIMLGLGLAGQMSRWPLLIVLLLSILIEYSFTWNDRKRKTRGLQAERESEKREVFATWIVVAVVAPFVFCMLLGAMSPQTDFDVVEYHLGGPKEWYQQGRITRLPHNVYTSFPFLTEMLLLSGMVLFGDWQWGALAGQAAIAGFVPLTAIGLYATGRRWFSARAGALAALVWLTTPWAYRISIIAYAEGGLACYLFAAFAIALRIVWDAQAAGSESANVTEGTTPALQRHRLSILAGLLSGSAMSCKYTGLISVVIPVGVMIALSVWRSPGPKLRSLMVTGSLFGAGVLVAVGPWLLKNAVETGNPFFPLAYSVFGGEGRDAVMDLQWRRGHSSHYAHPLDRLIDLSVKLTDVVANNDWHSALMFGLAPIALLAIWRKKVWLAWAFIAWQFLSWFLFTHHIDRFYVPMFPAVALLAGCGAAWITTFPVGRWCCIPVMATCILFNAEIMQIQGLTGFNAGRLDLASAEEIATSRYPSQRWLNREFAAGHLPADFKVLCVGEAALFHARFPYIYNTVFDRSLFEQWCAERSESGDFRLRPAEQIREILKQHGVTHILVNWAEVLRYREPGSYGYTNFAHPKWFAELQAAGILDPPLPLPDEISFRPVNNEKQRRLIVDWAVSLGVSVADRPGIRAIQLFPVRR